MTARQRLIPALLGLIAFTALGSEMTPSFWKEQWFYVGLGVAASSTFLEPHRFARPQDAFLNALGGIAIFFTAQRDPIFSLWISFLAFVSLVLAASLVAMLMREPDTLVKAFAFRLSTRLGRALVIGMSALAIEVVGRAARDAEHFSYFAIGVGLLGLATGTNWQYVLGVVRRDTSHIGMAFAAVGPRMLLVSAPASTIDVGTAVAVTGPAGECAGTVAARAPHRDGLRYHIALESEWAELCEAFPADLRITPLPDEAETIGAAGEGSTDILLRFEPFAPLDIGAPVALTLDANRLLYQVTEQRLVRTAWDGTVAVVSQATARQVGIPRDGVVRSSPHLPAAHAAITRAADLVGDLPESHYRVGVLKNTLFPIGIELGKENGGHLAILGMSGMGKTAVAQRIASSLGGSHVVLAADLTGEYADRLAFPRWDGSDLTTPGHYVVEPQSGGDPPRQIADFIASCMTAGRDEYKTGIPVPRVVLLEEAHSFVPEWNFIIKDQQQQVSRSTRNIMQARKYGVTFVMVSQRTAVVSKSALSQCENYVIFKTFDETSLEYLGTVVGTEFRNVIPALKRFEALCVGPAFNTEQPVLVQIDPP